jgi:uncharacterized protein YggE
VTPRGLLPGGSDAPRILTKAIECRRRYHLRMRSTLRFLPALSLLLLAAALMAPAPVLAGSSTVEVTGEAELRLPPDQAVLSLGVTTEAATAREAMEKNAQTMTAVMAALATAGFAGKDVRTQAVSLHPVMDYRPNEQPRIIGYRASNTVQVTTKDPASIGRALDAGVQAGANVSAGLAFTLADPRAAETQALRLAVQDAQQRAGAMAEALGKKITRVVEVRAVDAERIVPRPEMMAARAAAPTQTPIEPGLVTIRARAALKAEMR